MQASTFKEKQEQVMEAIVKVMSCLIGLFVFVNGVWIVMTPPFGDEPQGYAIIAIGIFIPLITLYLGRLTDGFTSR
ncbi:MAG: hypothetical protein LUQ31_09670 [Methanoregula sp.]|nr:hypothetical protein [Methanoregula sp.]